MGCLLVLVTITAWFVLATAQPHFDLTFVPEPGVRWKSIQSSSWTELFTSETLSELDVQLTEMGIFSLLQPYEIATEDAYFMSRRESWEQDIAVELASARRSLTIALDLALKNTTRTAQIVNRGILSVLLCIQFSTYCQL